MTFNCNLVPEIIQNIVNITANKLFIQKIREFTIYILKKFNDYIQNTLGINYMIIIKYIILIAVLIWIIDIVNNFIRNYICWFRSNKPIKKKSSSSSSSSSNSSSSSSSSSS
jgi:hypothetical protein